jgi:hypothetical protein
MKKKETGSTLAHNMALAASLVCSARRGPDMCTVLECTVYSSTLCTVVWSLLALRPKSSKQYHLCVSAAAIANDTVHVDCKGARKR